MRRRTDTARATVAALTATSGLVLAHVLDYAIVMPSASARQAVLAQTGHGYFHSAVDTALASAILAIVAALVTGFHRERAGVTRPSSFGRWARPLMAVQAAGFVGLELAERAAAHAGLHHYTDPTIPFGVLVQLAVAALAALALVLLERAGERLVRVRRRSAMPPRPAVWPRPSMDVLPSNRFLRPGRSRAPPSLAA